eukprot:3615111-Amphidinium_carterae.1
MASDNRIASGHIIKGSAESFTSDLMGGFSMRYHLGGAGMWPITTETQALLAGYTFNRVHTIIDGMVFIPSALASGA